MKKSAIYKLIYFDEFSATPKYRQLANAIIKAVEEGKLVVDDVLPSINDLSAYYEIARDTAEKGYKHLKGKGIVGSVPGKGYFIKSTELARQIKIFLLFNKLSAHKKIIYDAFVESLGNTASIDFYVYNNDFALFNRALQNCGDDYHYYVVIPHFTEGAELAYQVLNTIRKEKLILLDKLQPGITGEYGAVYQNFEGDIYNALVQAMGRLEKYEKIKIIFPPDTYHPKEILRGYFAFCREYDFNYEVIDDIRTQALLHGTVYISLMEDDLVILLEKILDEGLEIGQQIGVISYNETPIKRILLNGITTISTDFGMMGEKAAQLILTKSKEQIAIPFSLTTRNSL